MNTLSPYGIIYNVIIYYKMALGHIYTNNLPLALAPFTTISKTHLLKMIV